MSVINTMLKDLEKRENNFAENNSVLQGLGPRPSKPVPTETKNIYLISGLISLGIVVSLISVIYLVSPYQLVKTEPKPIVAESTQQSIHAQNANTPEPIEFATNTTNPQQRSTEITTANPATTPEPPSEPSPVMTANIEEPKPVRHLAQQTTAKAPESQPPKKIKAETKSKASTAQTNNISEETEDNTKASISRTQRSLSNDEKSQHAYATAMTLYNQGQHQSAKNSLKEALSYYPANKQARQLLAAIHIFEQRPDIAVTVIEQGLAIDVNDMDLLRVYLQALVQIADYPKAIGVMEKHFNLTTPEDMAYLAGLYQKNNQHLPAVKYFSQALRLIPNNSIWWMGQGISLEELGQTQQALDSYQQSITTGRLSSQLREFVLLRIVSIKSQSGPTS